MHNGQAYIIIYNQLLYNQKTNQYVGLYEAILDWPGNLINIGRLVGQGPQWLLCLK